MFDDEARKTALAHRDVVLAIRAVIGTDEGKKLFKYLFESFDVAQAVPQGFTGELLHGYLGLQRAGNAVFKIACEADHQISAALLALIEKERYDEIQKDAALGHGE